MRLYYKKVDTLSGSILIITRYRESDLSFGLFIHLETRRTTSLRTRQYLSRAVNSSTFPRNSNRELEPGSPLKGIESIVETERPVSFLFPVPPPPSLSLPLPDDLSANLSASARAPIRVYASKIFMGSVRANIKVEAHDRKRGLMIIDNSAITSRTRTRFFLSIFSRLTVLIEPRSSRINERLVAFYERAKQFPLPSSFNYVSHRFSSFSRYENIASKILSI